MAVKYSESGEKLTPAKKTVKIIDVFVKDLKFVDEQNGDITEQVIAGLPKGIDKVSFNITVELPSESYKEDGSDGN